MTNNGCRNAAI